MKGGPQQITARPKKFFGRPAVVLEASRLASDTEAHLGWLRRHVQKIHQTHEFGICFVVEYDEAGVDCDFAPRGGRVVWFGWPAGVSSPFQGRDVVVAVQMPGGGYAGDSSSNDCNFHQ